MFGWGKIGHQNRRRRSRAQPLEQGTTARGHAFDQRRGLRGCEAESFEEYRREFLDSRQDDDGLRVFGVERTPGIQDRLLELAKRRKGQRQAQTAARSLHHEEGLQQLRGDGGQNRHAQRAQVRHFPRFHPARGLQIGSRRRDEILENRGGLHHTVETGCSVPGSGTAFITARKTSSGRMARRHFNS